MISRKTAEELAYEFHGGQSSHLYSFASTGGVIWNQLHREGCRREIRAFLRWAISYLRSNKKSYDDDDIEQVQEDLRLALKLDAYFTKAKLSKISSKEHFDKLYAKRRTNPDRRQRCEICGRPEVDPMSLNSSPINRSLCYQRETGGDPRCKPPKTGVDAQTIKNHIAHVQDLIRTAPADDKVKLREIVKSLKLDLKRTTR